MTNKDELIKAAEMVKKYCESQDCDTCPMCPTCTFYLHTWVNLASYMKELQKCVLNDRQRRTHKSSRDA